MGDHGATILSRREGMEFDVELKSDCAPLGGLVAAMLKASDRIHTLRDPTRGGVAGVPNENAAAASIAIQI